MARSVVNTVHTLSVFQTTISAVSTEIKGIQDSSVDPQVERLLAYAAGDHRPSYVSLSQVQPILSFSTIDLKAALDLIDHLDGLGISGGTDVANMYFVKKAQVGARTSGANHQRFQSKLALIYLEEITATQNAYAEARFRVVTVYDGTNEALIPAGSISLPASINNLTQLFKLGKWDINGTNVDGVLSMTYRTGIDVVAKFAGGDHRPTFAGIARRAPSIELRTSEVPSYATFGISGTKGTGATTGYLYAVDEVGIVQTDVTAAHIKFTLQTNHHRIDMGPLSARNNDDGEGQITITPIFDGTNKEVIINTASAVT
jgi:hypothetical protein